MELNSRRPGFPTRIKSINSIVERSLKVNIVIYDIDKESTSMIYGFLKRSVMQIRRKG